MWTKEDFNRSMVANVARQAAGKTFGGQYSA